MAAGIYAIKHTSSGKLYVGSATDIFKRWTVHKSNLALGKHHSHRLQTAWDQSGPDSFQWLVLELVEDLSNLVAKEQQWLDHYQSYKPSLGYNILPVAGSHLGAKRSICTRLKQSKAAKERNAEPAYNKMISDRCRRQWQDPEFRELVEKGRPKVNPNKGKPMSEAQKQLLRESALARRSQMVEAAKKSVLARGFKLKG